MTLNLAILTKKELTTRKFWRNCFLIIYSLITICALLWGVMLLTSLEGSPYQLGSSFANGIIAVFLPAYVSYYCAYKKAGTCLLTMYLYLKPIEFLIKGFLIFVLPSPFNIILFVAMFLIATFFYTLNWKLRKINKKLQLHWIYPEDYVLATGTLERSDSRDTLLFVYSSLVQRWPQFEKHSTRLYKQLIQELTK